MTFDKSYHSNLIQNGLCPCYFYNIYLLKLVFMSILVFLPFFELWTSSSPTTRFLGMLRFVLESYLVEALYNLKASFNIQVTYCNTSQQIDSLCVRLSFGTQSPKKLINSKLFKTCKHGGIVKITNIFEFQFLNP